MKLFSAPFRLPVAVLVTLTCFTLFSGCDYSPFGYVPIKDVLQNPTRYEGQRVKVRGTVSEVTKIPILEIRLYTLNEGGYQIMVTTQGPVPAVGKEVSVIGVVENVAIIGNEGLGIHLREIKRLGKIL